MFKSVIDKKIQMCRWHSKEKDQDNDCNKNEKNQNQNQNKYNKAIK